MRKTYESKAGSRRHLKLPRPLIPMTRATTRRRLAADVQHVVVVGAGLSGLSAAARLRASGLKVTVLEAGETVGGRCKTERLTSAHGTFEADTGATVLTMPQLVEAAVQSLGQRMPDSWKLTKLSPAYTAQFASGRSIRLYSDPARMSKEIAEFAVAKFPEDASRQAERLVIGYEDYRDWSQDMFSAAFDNFLAADFDSVLDLVATPSSASDLGRLVGLGAFGSLARATRGFVSDAELARLFTFQALYAGQAPAKARAVYSVISHMDTGMGVFYPQHSIGEAAEAMASALVAAGAEVRTGTPVAEFNFDASGTSVSSVRLASGEVIETDAVICTTDLAVTDRLMNRPRTTQRRPVPLRWAPSAVVIHGTVPTKVADTFASQSHHTLSFGEAWDETFTQITGARGRGSLMTDPSLLITRPAKSAPSRIIQGAEGSAHTGETFEPMSILAPAPNLASAPVQWKNIQDRYVEEILRELDGRGFSGLRESLSIARVDTPQSWAETYGYGEGTPFGLAHTFAQTGPFRPRNVGSYGVDNVILAGSGTTPGVGVPTVLLSGALAARRITGGGVR